MESPLYAKNAAIATKWKADLLIDLWDLNETIGSDLDHNLDLEFSRLNMDFAISQQKMVQLAQSEKQS